MMKIIVLKHAIFPVAKIQQVLKNKISYETPRFPFFRQRDRNDNLTCKSETWRVPDGVGMAEDFDRNATSLHCFQPSASLLSSPARVRKASFSSVGWHVLEARQRNSLLRRDTDYDETVDATTISSSPSVW